MQDSIPERLPGLNWRSVQKLTNLVPRASFFFFDTDGVIYIYIKKSAGIEISSTTVLTIHKLLLTAVAFKKVERKSDVSLMLKIYSSISLLGECRRGTNCFIEIWAWHHCLLSNCALLSSFYTNSSSNIK